VAAAYKGWRTLAREGGKLCCGLHEWRGTIVAMSTESLRTVRDGFSDFVERVHGQHERIVITRNGTPAAVLMSPEDLESLEETLAILADPDALEAIVQAECEVADGDVVRGVEALRALRPQ